MGDYLKKQQARSFKKAREKAVDDAKQQSLVNRPLHTTVAFTIKPNEGKGIVPHEHLLLLFAGEKITAVRGHECIGTVEGEAAEIARRTMRDAGSPHAIKVIVTNVADLSGVAQAQIST